MKRAGAAIMVSDHPSVVLEFNNDMRRLREAAAKFIVAIDEVTTIARKATERVEKEGLILKCGDCGKIYHERRHSQVATYGFCSQECAAGHAVKEEEGVIS